ncbi:MAG: cysteine desulfurase family protein [Lysinibacillus sp.]
MIYLDNSATTKPLPEVMQTFVQVSEQYYANPASIHEAGNTTNQLLTKAREQLANILNTDAKQVIFTAGGTEANNFAVYSVSKTQQHIGKHVITTAVEHPSILQSVKRLHDEGFDVDYLDVDERGVISLEQLASKLRKDTIFVSVMHVNNEMGAIQPIEEIAKLVHEKSRALFHVDAVQSFGKLPVHFNGDLGPDMISVSGHKIHSVKGSGFLALRRAFTMVPFIVGGGQEFGLRSGTAAVPQAVALAKAARIATEKLDERYKQYKQWSTDLYAFFRQFDEHVHMLSSDASAPYILSFSVRDLKGEILINALQKDGVFVSTSSACSSKMKKTSHVVTALNIPQAYKDGVLRLSFGSLTTNEDIEGFKRVFNNVMSQLKGEVTV